MTLPPWSDVTGALPELDASARIAYRCHPATEWAADEMLCTLGGSALWPAKMRWPTCPRCAHEDGTKSYLRLVIQLHQAAAPDIQFPLGKDLFQLMWCSHRHQSYCPQPYIFWHKTSAIRTWRHEMPADASNASDFRFESMPLQLEPVKEYPNWYSFSQSQQTRLSEWLDEGMLRCYEAFPEFFENAEAAYQHELSAAPGIKLGGYPRWIQCGDADPWWDAPRCQQGHRMELLVTLNWDGQVANKSRWFDKRDSALDSSAPLGDQQMLIFVCRACKDWPIRFTLDS